MTTNDWGRALLSLHQQLNHTLQGQFMHCVYIVFTATPRNIGVALWLLAPIFRNRILNGQFAVSMMLPGLFRGVGVGSLRSYMGALSQLPACAPTFFRGSGRLLKSNPCHLALAGVRRGVLFVPLVAQRLLRASRYALHRGGYRGCYSVSVSASAWVNFVHACKQLTSL